MWESSAPAVTPTGPATIFENFFFLREIHTQQGSYTLIYPKPQIIGIYANPAQGGPSCITSVPLVDPTTATILFRLSVPSYYSSHIPGFLAPRLDFSEISKHSIGTFNFQKVNFHDFVSKGYKISIPCNINWFSRERLNNLVLT